MFALEFHFNRQDAQMQFKSNGKRKEKNESGIYLLEEKSRKKSCRQFQLLLKGSFLIRASFSATEAEFPLSSMWSEDEKQEATKPPMR